MANQKRKKTTQNRKIEFLGLLLIILGVFVLLSLLSYNPGDWPNSSSRGEVQNWMGLAGAWLSFYLYNFTIGYPALVIPFLIIYWGWFLIKRTSLIPITRRSGYILFFALCFSVAFALPQKIIQEGAPFSLEFNGVIGLFFADLLHKYLGSIGSVLALFTIMLFAFLSLTEVSISGLLLRFAEEVKQVKNHWSAAADQFVRQRKLKRSLKAKQKSFTTGKKTSEPESTKTESLVHFPGHKTEWTSEGSANKPTDLDFENQFQLEEQIENEETLIDSFSPEKQEREPDLPDSEKEDKKQAPERIEVNEIPVDYKIPTIDLLNELPPYDKDLMKSQLLQEARVLEEKLSIYGIEAKVVQIHPGPLITQFEVEPGEGVKISKFFGIADDLAMVMRAQQIRILAPIPGKAVVGIEIPNRKPQVISFYQIIDSDEFRSTSLKLPLALGVDTTGKVYLADLVRMPHLLIAGSTGSGKSVCLNAIIASLLYRHTPEDLRLILIDPKKLELSSYSELVNHHLITLPEMNEEVITTPENAILILGRVWQEMEDRFTILARANVRTLEDYNKKIENGEINPKNHAQPFKKIPYIVVIIDELADLLMVSGQDVEEPIGKLAHKARAVGIHLIVATQRPSTDVITGAIKANFPCRIAFKVFSKTDSRVVLDVNGAEKLLGRGDMLLQPPGQPTPVRLHSPMVSNEEINRIIGFIGDQPPFPEYSLPEDKSEVTVEMPDGRKVVQQRDPLFYEALKLIVRHQQGSISLLQRRLRIGYARAARIIDEMEQAGFVGAFDGSKARDVLIGEDELDEMGIL